MLRRLAFFIAIPVAALLLSGFALWPDRTNVILNFEDQKGNSVNDLLVTFYNNQNEPVGYALPQFLRKIVVTPDNPSHKIPMYGDYGITYNSKGGWGKHAVTARISSYRCEPEEFPVDFKSEKAGTWGCWLGKDPCPHNAFNYMKPYQRDRIKLTCSDKLTEEKSKHILGDLEGENSWKRALAAMTLKKITDESIRIKALPLLSKMLESGREFEKWSAEYTLYWWNEAKNND